LRKRDRERERERERERRKKRENMQRHISHNVKISTPHEFRKKITALSTLVVPATLPPATPYLLSSNWGL
jgi:hypothetical protein